MSEDNDYEISNDTIDEVVESIHDRQEEMIKSRRVDNEYDIGEVPELYPLIKEDPMDNKKLILKSITHQHQKSLSGWHADSPKPGTERHQLEAKCGDKCFLDPAREAYPICDKECNVDCRGLHAAYIRARQNHQDDIAEEAQNLLRKFNC